MTLSSLYETTFDQSYCRNEREERPASTGFLTTTSYQDMLQRRVPRSLSMHHLFRLIFIPLDDTFAQCHEYLVSQCLHHQARLRGQTTQGIHPGSHPGELGWCSNQLLLFCGWVAAFVTASSTQPARFLLLLQPIDYSGVVLARSQRSFAVDRQPKPLEKNLARTIEED